MNRALITEFGSYMLMTILGFALGIGALYTWQSINKPTSVFDMETSAHFVGTDKPLILYSASWCQYCQKVKDYLIRHQVAFENRDIESTDPSVLQLFQALGAEGIPQLVIRNKVIRGADLAAIEQELKQQQLLPLPLP